jgi:hypothetical protein
MQSHGREEESKRVAFVLVVQPTVKLGTVSGKYVGAKTAPQITFRHAYSVLKACWIFVLGTAVE